LDLEFDDFYAAWEAYNYSTVEDYLNEEKLLTKATKQFWITKAPETLIF
jgi:hypothetical protein